MHKVCKEHQVGLKLDTATTDPQDNVVIKRRLNVIINEERRGGFDFEHAKYLTNEDSV